RSPDVQIEAIFAHPVGPEDHVAIDRCLHTSGAELRGAADARPVPGWLRRLPAQIAHRRRRERDAPIDVNAALLRDAFDGAVCSLDPVGCTWGRGNSEHD